MLLFSMTVLRHAVLFFFFPHSSWKLYSVIFLHVGLKSMSSHIMCLCCFYIFLLSCTLSAAEVLKICTFFTSFYCWICDLERKPHKAKWCRWWENIGHSQSWSGFTLVWSMYPWWEKVPNQRCRQTLWKHKSATNPFVETTYSRLHQVCFIISMTPTLHLHYVRVQDFSRKKPNISLNSELEQNYNDHLRNIDNLIWT